MTLWTKHTTPVNNTTTNDHRLSTTLREQRHRSYKDAFIIITRNSPVFGDGARMALTPNFRKVGSLLVGREEHFGECESRVMT